MVTESVPADTPRRVYVTLFRSTAHEATLPDLAVVIGPDPRLPRSHSRVRFGDGDVVEYANEQLTDAPDCPYCNKPYNPTNVPGFKCPAPFCSLACASGEIGVRELMHDVFAGQSSAPTVDAPFEETFQPPAIPGTVTAADVAEKVRAQEPSRFAQFLSQHPVASGALAALEALLDFDVRGMTDEAVAIFYEMVREQKRDAASAYDEIANGARNELHRRLRERGARAIVSKHFKKIEREAVYTAYAFDVERLRAAAARLPDDEAAKVLRHVPERRTVVPAHDEPGNPVSIKALIEKYGADSEVGKDLTAGMSRQQVDEKLVIVAKPVVAPKKTEAEL